MADITLCSEGGALDICRECLRNVSNVEHPNPVYQSWLSPRRGVASCQDALFTTPTDDELASRRAV